MMTIMCLSLLRARAESNGTTNSVVGEGVDVGKATFVGVGAGVFVEVGSDSAVALPIAGETPPVCTMGVSCAAVAHAASKPSASTPRDVLNSFEKMTIPPIGQARKGFR